MAKDAGEIVVDGSELLRSIRIGVKMPPAFGLRMWLASHLLYLVGWLTGTKVVVEIDDDDGAN